MTLDFTAMLSRDEHVDPAEVQGDLEVTQVTAPNPVESPAKRFVEQLRTFVYSADVDAAREPGYFTSSDGQLTYKDTSGAVPAGRGGLSAGEDFDGQGTSSFQNLESVGVDGLRRSRRDGVMLPEQSLVR